MNLSFSNMYPFWMCILFNMYPFWICESVSFWNLYSVWICNHMNMCSIWICIVWISIAFTLDIHIPWTTAGQVNFRLLAPFDPHIHLFLIKQGIDSIPTSLSLPLPSLYSQLLAPHPSLEPHALLDYFSSNVSSISLSHSLALYHWSRRCNCR